MRRLVGDPRRRCDVDPRCSHPVCVLAQSPGTRDAPVPTARAQRLDTAGAADRRRDRRSIGCRGRSSPSGVPTGVVYEKAFGQRALVPAREAMTTDTIFDVASLTKVVATTTSVMMLLEQGRIGLDDAVVAYIPEFGRYGKQRITIRHLLTHVSGLRGDLDHGAGVPGRRRPPFGSPAEEVPVAAPGQRFIYSDINFFLLGEIVARVSGERLDAFARTHIFEPLGMRDTMFLPPAALVPRIAPTEACATARVAVRRTGCDDAARRRARSDGAAHGWRGRPCRPVQHGRRPVALLPHAAERRARSTACACCRR